MKAAFVGSVRGYQPPVYRPGMGWTASGSDGRAGRGPAVFGPRRVVGAGPFILTQRRRTGLKARIAIVAVVVTIISLPLILLNGSIQI